MHFARVTCLAVVLVSIGSLARAEWPGPSGLPVATTVHGHPVALTSDGSGGVLVAYQGAPVPGGAAIRLQRVLADGAIAPGWPIDGVVACSLATTSQLGVLQVVSNGNGGAYLVWNETVVWYVPGTGYAQHILGDGSRAPGWPARGRILVPGGNQQQDHQALADGSGGVLVAWTSNHTVQSVRILANRFNAPGFPTTGLLLWDQLPLGTSGEPSFSLVPDGVAGFWAAAGLVSADTLQVPSSYRLLHLQPNGLIDSNWLVDGYGVELPVPASAWVTGGARAVADGADGAYVLARLDDRAMLAHVLSWQVLDPDWPAPWLDLGIAGDVWGAMAGLEPDGAGGLYALWAKPFVAAGKGGLRRVRTDGTLDPAWPASLSITATFRPTLLADATGVYASGTYFMMCVHRDCLGLSAVGRWSQDGSVPASWLPGSGGGFTTGEFGLPVDSFGGPASMVRDGAGGIFAAWTVPDVPNQGYGSSGTVRVMRFSNLGPVADAPVDRLPPARTLRARWVAHSGILVTAASVANARLEVCDITGRRIASGEMPASITPADWLVPGTSALSPGLYFLKLRRSDGDALARVVVVR